MTFALTLILATITTPHNVTLVSFERAGRAVYVENEKVFVCEGHVEFRFGPAVIKADRCVQSVYRSGFES